MSKSRVVSFLRVLLIIFIILSVLVLSLWIIQDQTGSLSPILSSIDSFLKSLSTDLNKPLMTGISIGMIILALLVVLIPLMMKGIIKKQYLVAVRRGVISAVVFFASQLLYAWAEAHGRSYLVLMIIIVLLLSYVMIELLARMLKESEENSFRTDLTASFAAGLASGIVLKLLEVIVKQS